MKLSDLKVQDILPSNSKKVVTVSYFETIDKVLQKLSENSILSCPVIGSNHECMGLVDVLDCVKFALDLYFENTKELTEEDWKNYAIQLAFGLNKVENIINSSQKNPYFPVTKETPFIDVLKEFSKGLKRAPCLDKSSNPATITNMLSQIDCVSFFADHLDELFPNLGNKTLQEIKLGNKTNEDNTTVLFSVEANDLTAYAYQLMYAAGVSAVGIEQNDEIISNLSASDLVGLIDSDFQKLGDPVISFAEYVRKKKNRTSNLISCTPSTTLREVLNIFKTERIHRIYVFELNSKINYKDCIGLITLTDVIAKMLEQ